MNETVNLERHSRELCRVVEEELEAATGSFHAAGLAWTSPELVVWNNGVDSYAAELKVEFFQAEDLVDVFEFFVVRNGAPTVTTDELRRWLRENIPRVLALGSKD